MRLEVSLGTRSHPVPLYPPASRPPPPTRPPHPTAQSVVPARGTPSLLVFEGALRVHGLFDLLLNDAARLLGGDELDAPVLLAPTPFLHAALVSHAPRLLSPTNAQDPARVRHRLELKGLLPPWVLDRAAAILAVTQARARGGLCACVSLRACACERRGGGAMLALPGRRLQRTSRCCPPAPPLSLAAGRQLQLQLRHAPAHTSAQLAARRRRQQRRQRGGGGGSSGAPHTAAAGAAG